MIMFKEKYNTNGTVEISITGATEKYNTNLSLNATSVVYTKKEISDDSGTVEHVFHFYQKRSSTGYSGFSKVTEILIGRCKFKERDNTVVPVLIGRESYKEIILSSINVSPKNPFEI